MSSTARAARVERARRSSLLAIAVVSLAVVGPLGSVVSGLAGDDVRDVVVTAGNQAAGPPERSGISGDTDDRDQDGDPDDGDDGGDRGDGNDRDSSDRGNSDDRTDDADARGRDDEPTPTTTKPTAGRTRPAPATAAATVPQDEPPPSPRSAGPPTRRNDGAVVVPPSIDATGGADVTDELNHFIKSVPNDSVLRFRAGGRYRIEGTVLIKERRGLVIDGNGATLVATTPGDKTRSHVRIEGASNVRVSNLTVRGAHPNGGEHDAAWVPDKEHQHGINIRNSDHVTIEGTTITDVYGDFVHVGRYSTTTPWSAGVVIRNNTFSRNGRQGIGITAARDLLIEGNRLSQVRRSTFDIEPGGQPLNDRGDAHGVERVTIRGNTVRGGRHNFVAAAGKGQADDITIEGNELFGRSMEIFVNDKDGGRRKNWVVIDNQTNDRFNAPHGALMRFERVDGIVVRGNHAPLYDTPRNLAGGGPMVLVEAKRSCGVEVDRNLIGSGMGQKRLIGSC